MSGLQVFWKRFSAPLGGRVDRVDAEISAIQPVLSYILHNARNDERPYLKVYVHGVPLLGLLDSGASRTFLCLIDWKLLRGLELSLNANSAAVTVANVTKRDVAAWSS